VKATTLLVVFLTVPILVFATPQNDFWKFLNAGDYPNALQALQAWDRTEPNSPEVVVGYINYHFNKSKSYGYSIDDFVRTGSGQEGTKLTFHDPKGGKDYYFNNKVFYDKAEIDESMRYFDLGISEFRDRLDLRFGKIHVLNEVEDYLTAGAETARTLERSIQNSNAWLWTGNKPYGKKANGFLEDLQDYYNAWIKSQVADGFAAVKVAAEAQIKLYPNHSWAYDNLALYYSSVHDDENQIRLLLESLQVDPMDMITINNVANFYRLHNDRQKALQYYNMMLKSGDPNAKARARQMIDSLNQGQQ
jgi:tetratricopeptide (TPR) repeat protein